MAARGTAGRSSRGAAAPRDLALEQMAYRELTHKEKRAAGIRAAQYLLKTQPMMPVEEQRAELKIILDMLDLIINPVT